MAGKFRRLLLPGSSNMIGRVGRGGTMATTARPSTDSGAGAPPRGPGASRRRAGRTALAQQHHTGSVPLAGGLGAQRTDLPEDMAGALRRPAGFDPVDPMALLT